MTAGVILTILALAIAAGAVLLWRGLQFRALAARGIPATATVTRRFTAARRGQGNVKRIGFAYAGPDGRAYERWASISRSRWQDLAEGDPLPIYLLPDKPGVSAPAWLVEAARSVRRT